MRGAERGRSRVDLQAAEKHVVRLRPQQTGDQRERARLLADRGAPEEDVQERRCHPSSGRNVAGRLVEFRAGRERAAEEARSTHHAGRTKGLIDAEPSLAEATEGARGRGRG